MDDEIKRIFPIKLSISDIGYISSLLHEDRNDDLVKYFKSIEEFLLPKYLDGVEINEMYEVWDKVNKKEEFLSTTKENK